MAQRRAYLNEQKEISFHFGSDIPRDADLSEIFYEITRRLEAVYSINKGVLVLRKENENCFSAISTWQNGQLRDGLAINLPNDTSLFERVAADGIVYTEDFGGLFSGNFFERKLLLDDATKSYAVHPLKYEGTVIGLLAYSSEEPTAFTMFEEGALLEMTGEFASIIKERLITGNLH